MPFSIESVLLFASLLFIASLLASKVGNRFGLPVLLLFLGVGMFFGVDGPFHIHFDNYEAAQVVGTVALCIILFSGGLDTKIEEIKPVMYQGALLATVGVLFTAFITGAFIYSVANTLIDNIQLTFLEALLLASVMSSTDSASVFSILRSKGVSLKHRLRPLLEFESGSNDPMAYMLTIILIGMITSSQSGEGINYGTAIVNFFLQLIVGGIGGCFLGKVSVWVINKIRLPNDSLYPILLFACCIFIFSAVYFCKGNGFLAVYIAGLIIGNSKFVHKRTSLRIFDGLTWFSQITMFLTLGLLVNPHELLPVAFGSLLIASFMMFAGRPISVMLTLLPFCKMPFKDKFFVSWVGLRGAVPIIFAIYPLAAGLEHSRLMFNIVFFITLLSLLLQGTTITKFANLLGLSKDKEEEKKLEYFDVEFSDEIKSTMSEILVTEEMLTEGNQMINLNMPPHTLVVMVKRNESYFVPKGQTKIEVGDKLLLITDSEEALKETRKNLGIEKIAE
jgi:cell volume regulation protein A